MISLLRYILESTGLFPNSEKYVDVIYDYISNPAVEKDNGMYIDIPGEEFKDIPNTFVKRITICLVPWDKLIARGKYVTAAVNNGKEKLSYNLSRWDTENKVFNWIDIFLPDDYMDLDEDDLKETLTHELQHAYQDYKSFYNKGYGLYKSDSLKNKSNKHDDYSVDYLLDKDEREAFTTNICKFTKPYIDKKSIKEIFDLLNDRCENYQDYKTLYLNTFKKDCKYTNKQIKTIQTFWNKLNNHIYSYIIQNSN